MDLSRFSGMAQGVAVQTVDPQEVYRVVMDASCQDPSRVQSSGQTLKRMFDMLGTFDALQEIAAQRTLPIPIRQQAIIQFKNGALGHWRSRKILSEEHRARIRARSLTLLDETDDTISDCNEVIVAKIARLDFPGSWPDLLDSLINTIDARLTSLYSHGHDENQDALVLRRSLGLLNAVVKEFSSMKMLNGVKVMVNNIFSFRDRLYGYYTTLAANLASSLNPQTILTEKTHQDIVIIHLLYKSLTKLALWSWQRLDKHSKEEAERAKAWQGEIFSFSSNFLRRLFQKRKDIVLSLNMEGRMSQAHKPVKALTNHVRTYGKYFRRLEQLGPSRFVELPQCGDLVLYYWQQVVDATSGDASLIKDTHEAVYPTRFLVQGMVLFKDSLSQWAPKRRDGTDNPNTLSQEFVQNAVQLLITRFMPLNPADLEAWLADPEEWLNVEDKENDQWEFEIRPCSERVLIQLTNNYSDYIVPLLSSVFNRSAVTPAIDPNSVIQKEAVYCALGRCVHRLKNEIPFDQWLQHTLVVEAKESMNPSYPILKRRIAWLIGKWVSEDCASPRNALIWDILVHLLKDRSPATDTVVRLTAATAIRECMDTVEFSVDYFLPHLAATISELVRLIGDAETFESKRRVDNTLNVVIEQTGQQVSPYVPMIVGPLPQLWTAAGDDWLFKASLLVTVTKLIEALKSDSSSLGGVVVPLVRQSLAPGSIVHLDDDGLNLWLAALRNTTTIASLNGAPPLSELIPDALNLLANNLDLLGTVINIVESYVLLDSSGLTQAYGNAFLQAYTQAIRSEMLVMNKKDMIVLMNLYVQCTPSAAWVPLFHSSGLFAWVLEKLVENESNTMLMTEYIYLFSRIAMSDPRMLLQLISAAAVQLNQQENYLMEGLLDQWWGKFDNMSEPRHRKLTAMGIASLLSTGRSEVLERLPTEIFNLWLDVFGEIKEAQNYNEINANGSDSPPPLRRYWDVDEAPSWFYQNTEGTPEYDRRKAIYDNDPVRTIQLNRYIAEKLQEAERNSNPQAFKAVLDKADPTVLKQIQAEVLRQ